MFHLVKNVGLALPRSGDPGPFLSTRLSLSKRRSDLRWENRWDRPVPVPVPVPSDLGMSLLFQAERGCCYYILSMGDTLRVGWICSQVLWFGCRATLIEQV